MRIQRFVSVGSCVAAGVALLAVLNCGGSSSNPATPTPVSQGNGGTNSSGGITIAIVQTDSSMSFSPPNVVVQPGQQVVWFNADSTTHRIAGDAGEFDTGNLAPGATSAPVTVSNTNPLPYHCTIHPSMVGSLNGSGAQPPSPCQGQYCG